METLFNLVPLIVFLPVLGLLINIIFGGKMGEKAIGAVASAASGLAFVVSVLLGVALWTGGGAAHCVPFADWISIGTLNIPWTFRVDTLSVTMMLVVSGVGTLIHIYAIGYMHEDVRFKHDVEPLPPLLCLHEPVHRHDDDPGQRRLVPDAVRRLGGRGPVLVPADRLLV